MQSLWLSDLATDPQAAVARTLSTEQLPPSCEFVIVGGGLSGVSLAYFLSHAKRSCMVLESACLASGASGNNGGICWTTNTHGADSIFEVRCTGTEEVRGGEDMMVVDINAPCDLVWLAHTHTHTHAHKHTHTKHIFTTDPHRR